MLKIIANDLKIFLRDREVLFWAFVLPIVLVVLLGNALKSQFPTRDNINQYFKDITIEYMSHADEQVTQGFESFLNTMQEDMEINYQVTEDMATSIQKVKDKTITIAVEIKSDTEFVVTKNRTFKSDLAETFINLYVEKYNLLQTVQKEGVPAFMQDVYDSFYEQKDYNAYNTFNKITRDMSAMDYYGIANIFAMMFWVTTTVLPVFNHEKKMGLLGRVRIAGIGKSTYILSKYVSITAFLLLEAILLLLFNKYLLNVYIGEDVPRLILLIVSSVLMVSALSTFILAYFTKLDKGIGILNTFIPVVVFLGGGIIPILDFSVDSGLNSIAQYTPLFVQNKSAFALINGGNTAMVNTGLVYNTVLTLVLLVAAVMIFNRKEVR
ncbi:ABC transporter permease [Vallitalea pronyensis]|uniref:ABC transporter permease n=1 Tax=Vallitalea pronyensis TaxID=1348613 RepID=A0A8J8MPV2_9FIRM|nr:ABC transporter permease [Vallitalea pronyensis]QUI25531.1 ABC transporter permease [Vallitalea pronyensis]